MSPSPDPWVAKTGLTSWGGPLPPRIEAGGKQIAVVECHEHIYDAEGDRDEDAEAARDNANAFIMAAGRDLLAACEAFVELFRNCDMRPEDECHEVFSVCRRAIAKAKGGAA